MIPDLLHRVQNSLHGLLTPGRTASGHQPGGGGHAARVFPQSVGLLMEVGLSVGHVGIGVSCLYELLQGGGDVGKVFHLKELFLSPGQSKHLQLSR